MEKSALMDEVWPGTNVGDDNLRQHIRSLRQKLGENPNGQDYIRNIPNRGCYLAVNVCQIAEEVPVEASTGNLETVARPAGSDASFPKRRARSILAWADGTALVLAVALNLGRAHQPVVVSVRPPTKDGEPKVGPIFTDGTRVYFMDSNHHRSTPVSVAVNGGEVRPFPAFERRH